MSTFPASIDITRNYTREDILLAAAIVEANLCECCGKVPAIVPVNFSDGELFFTCRPCATLASA